MGSETEIAWCDSTFNPWVGCTKVSAGCANCYAAAQDKRWGHDRWGPGKARTRTTESNWRQPLRWDAEAKRLGVRRRVFCASLADVFDAEVPAEWRRDLFALIDKTPSLDWLLLTKRPENYRRWGAATAQHTADPIRWPANVWLGVTVENQEQAERRIPLLLAQEATVRFLSCEPLLAPLDLTPWLVPPCRISWLIIGGESGHHARPFDLGWARSLVVQCRHAGVTPFVKQAGAHCVDLGTRLLLDDRAGADPAEWPADLRVREFPISR